MGKLQHGSEISTRAVPKVQVPYQDIDPGTQYMLTALARIHRVMKGLAEQALDFTRPVDEYAIVGGYTGVGDSFVEVQPQFDTMSERIESVIVTGPVTTAFTLQLGDRNWTLSTDATGKVVLAPVSLQLGRNDRRLLTSATAGNWTLELMGHGDKRF